jgi:hypothetical protein
MSITTWVDGRIKVAVDEATANIATIINARIDALEHNVMTTLEQLPETVVKDIGVIAVDAEKVAASVVGQLFPQLQGIISPIAGNVTGGVAGELQTLLPNLLNPQAIAQQIWGNLQNLLPHFP